MMESETEIVSALSWPVGWWGDRDKWIHERITNICDMYHRRSKKKSPRCIKIEMDTFLGRGVRNSPSEPL